MLTVFRLKSLSSQRGQWVIQDRTVLQGCFVLPWRKLSYHGLGRVGRENLPVLLGDLVMDQ